MKVEEKIPYFVKPALICIGLLSLVTILFFAQPIIVPVIYSIIIAIVLTPIVNFFTKRKWNRVLAIAVTLMLVIVVTILFFTMLSMQIMQFSDSFPKLLEKFDQLSVQSVQWTSQHFHISTQKINAWVTEKNKDILNNTGTVVAATLMSTGNVLVVIVLIPVYVFMILYYQPLLVEFVHRLFSTNKEGEINEIMRTIKGIIQSYLVGLILEACIIAGLNATSLLIIGIDYAILLGVIGAVINVVPFIGGIVSVALPMIIALATKSVTYALIVLAAYIFIQFIDNHLVIPKIVASKVKINALMSVIVVLAFGALWGIGGMFLAIPLTAIVKVICDHVDPLKPFGFLLGNIVPTASNFSLKKLKLSSKRSTADSIH